MVETPLVETRDLVVDYSRRRSLVGAAISATRVLHGVSIAIGPGETVGIVGESGSGKTTLGRALLGLVSASAGSVLFEGRPLAEVPGGEMALRRAMQMIFQDPMSSLNPRHTLRRILTRPLLLHGMAGGQRAAEARVAAMLERVDLPATVLDRYPHELSGGQRQRIGIARAAILEPRFVLADEIVSGQDVSTQARILQLLKGLTAERNMAMAFISHDLSVIRAICDRVYVLSGGKVVEEGPCEAIFTAPRQDYTRQLIEAIPLPVVDTAWLAAD